MTATLVDIGHMLAPMIERLAETEAHDVNMVILTNKKSFAEVSARLEAEDITYYHNQRICWEECEDHWRQLRHDHAVKMQQDRFNSNVYKNPPQRVTQIDELKAAQQARHDSNRLPLLEKLREMRPPHVDSGK